MYILGVCGQERNAAAALVCDGQVVAAVEEEGLARIRNVGMTYAGGLPYRAIEFCLERAGIRFDQINVVAYNCDPYKLFQRQVAFFSSGLVQAADDAHDESFPHYFVDSLNRLKERISTRRLIESLLPPNGRFVAVERHMAHAASAFYPSGFDKAAVMSLCNTGDLVTTALICGEGHRLVLRREALFPNSIGLVYSTVTSALGFGGDVDCHKTM
jgi:carbamoyltransferase